MQDPALSLMLHRSDIKNESKDSSSHSTDQTRDFNRALAKNIKEYTDALIKEQDPDAFKFLSKSALQEKVEKEVYEMLNFAEIGELIVSGIKIIINEGHSYLSNKDYENLINEIESLEPKINSLSFDQLTNDSFKSAFSVSEGCRKALLHNRLHVKFEIGCK